MVNEDSSRSARVAKGTKTEKTVEAPHSLGASSAASIADFAIKKRKRQILKYISLEGKVILDVGCGNGLYTLALDKLARKTIGVDIRQEALAEATKSKAELARDTGFIRAQAESLPLRDLTFDVVFLVEMLEHVQSEERTLEEAHRVLKYGGFLLIYVPNKLYPFDVHGLQIGQTRIGSLYAPVFFFSWFPQSIRDKFQRARIYTKGQITRLIERHGFIIQTVDHMYPPLDRIGSRFAKSVLRKLLSILEHNRFLKRFGMSIFIVAQKEAH